MLRRFVPQAVSVLSQQGDEATFVAAACHVAAGCWALELCAHLAQQAVLSDSDAFAIAAAAQLLFDAGPLLLVRSHQASCDVLRVKAAAAVAQRLGFLESATEALLQHAPSAAARERECTLVMQLLALASVMKRLLPPARRPQPAAAFAGSTARPEVLLPWLSSITGVVCPLIEPLIPYQGEECVGPDTAGQPAACC